MRETLAELGAVSIDVDSLRCYREIHGLPSRDDEDDPIYTKALPRFCQAMERARARGTIFIIGSDLGRPAHRDAVARAAKAGHEVASHSHAHDYALSTRSFAEITSDLWRCDDVIRDVAGRRPVGFRAPGYNQSDTLMDALEALGYAYDSSFFPTPAYFAARGAALAAYRVRGRPSRSLLGDAREFLAPRAPFRPSRKARFRPARPGEDARPFVELPMGVASRARLPWLGTTLALLPRPLGAALTKAALKGPGPAVLELHAIDFLGADDAKDPALAAAQGDLRVPLTKKARRLDAAIGHLSRARQVATLEDIAKKV